MKTYTLWNDAEPEYVTVDTNKISQVLGQLLQVASTIQYRVISEPIRLDVCNYARECDKVTNNN